MTVVSVASLLVLFREDSLRVHERPLGEWVLDLSYYSPGPVRRKAEAVIREYGTDGLPVYLSMLQQEQSRPSGFPGKAREWVVRQFDTHEGRATEGSNLLAAKAIVLLGARAASAVPALTNLISSSNAEVQGSALFALSRIETPEALAAYQRHANSIRTDN